jgi:ribosomal protein S18 acetylase RimI-like enzyme
MTNKIEIQKYSIDDKDTVYEIFTQYKHMFSTQNLRDLDERELVSESTEDYYKYVVLMDNRIIAFAAIKNDTDSAGRWELKWLAVDNKILRMGIGTRLMNFLEEKVKEYTGKAIILDTLFSDHEVSKMATSFYEKVGFTKAGFFENYWGEGYSKIVYQKILE